MRRRGEALQHGAAAAQGDQGALEALGQRAHAAFRGSDVRRGLADLGLEAPELLTVGEAARLLRFDADAKDLEKAMRDFAAAHQIPAWRRGRRLLFDRRVLLAVALKPA